jgi:hypothetical protein
MMITKSDMVVAALLLALLAIPNAADAQTRTATVGKTVRLQLPDHRLVGTLTAVGEDTVYLRTLMDGPSTSIVRGEIRSVEMRLRGEHVGRRMLIGALIGGVITGAGGLWLSYNVPCADCVFTTNDRVLGTAMFAAGGMVVGGVLAFLSNPGRWMPAELR